MATELIKAKCNPYLVKEILGHESIETTTKHYLKLTITDLKEAMKYHPREKNS